jgi:hypothetical protein
MRWRELIEPICPTAKAKYFGERGLDDPNQLEISAQIEVCAQRIFLAVALASEAGSS